MGISLQNDEENKVNKNDGFLVYITGMELSFLIPQKDRKMNTIFI